MQTETKLPPGLTPEMVYAKRVQWLKDPLSYFTERLGIPENLIDEHEKQLLAAIPRAIRERKSIVVPSANAMGKDWTISGRASLWFYECFAPCKVIMTAPTERQTLDVMWSELRTAYNARPVKDPMGRMTTGKLTYSDEHFITAFTTKEGKEQVGKFQGFHSPRLMVIVSEAQAVDDAIFEQIQSITMAGYCLPVYLGNPLTNIGKFAKMVEDTKNNIVIHLDAYDCINVKEKRVVIPGLVTWDWVKAREEEWNADKTGKDPRYQARVRGQLPTSSINSVISKELYKKCIGRTLTWWSGKFGTIGVDPAGTGTDDMVISVFISGEQVDELVIPYCEAPEACAHIASKQKEWFPDGGCVVVIDSDGMGAPIAQFYQTMVPEGLPNEVQLIEYHGSCTDREVVDPEFHNTRAEANFYAKKRMMDGHISLDGNEYAQEEATNVLYFPNTTNGRLQLESKDDIKSRLGRSPNRWDARVCAIWGFKFANKINSKDEWRESGARVFQPGGSAMAA